MEKLLDNGINLHKSLAMGLDKEAYGSGKGGYGKPKPKPSSGPPKGPKPVKMDSDESFSEKLY